MKVESKSVDVINCGDININISGRIVYCNETELLSKEKWDDLDVTFGCVVIANTQTYEQAIQLVEKVLNYNSVFEEIAATALMNLSIRLVKARFIEHIDLEKLTRDFYS